LGTARPLRKEPELDTSNAAAATRPRPAAVASPRGDSAPFPPIADYAFLSDCEATALIASTGSVEWMCLPRMDSQSVFGALLDRDAGHFRLGPAGVQVPASRNYLPGTMVLETTWDAPGGWLVVQDALLLGPWRHEDERSTTHRRAATDYDAEHVLVRIMHCVNGEVQVALECQPVFDYGKNPASWRFAGDDYHDGVATGGPGGTELRLTTDLRLGFEGARAIARHLMKEGDVVFCALSWSAHQPPRSSEEARSRLTWTANHWRHWLDRGRFPDHPWRSHLQRSALTLKGLTYAPTGALLAAATTGLPEEIGGERNWDYRYTWIRDSTFMLWALYSLGYDWEANDFFYFMADLAERDDDLQIMYTVDGAREIPERELPHLSGYAGSRPVRIGNAACQQRQHDVWGALLNSIHLHNESRDALDERTWSIVRRQVDATIRHWREPDHGVWEVRGEPKHFTSSKVFCWVACDRGARLARLREEHELAARWQSVADDIHAEICERATDERGVFTQHYGTTALDSSVLAMPLLGFLPGDDERVKSTVLAIAQELTEGGLVLRYRIDETDDGLSGHEGTFIICSFLLVSALVEIGELQHARELCERVIGYASPLGLYAEELDPVTGRHLGNFPQAFTHLALITALISVIRAEGRPSRRRGMLSFVNG
jgi:GH15 family glucan-1,4-alpha-glucosidase